MKQNIAALVILLLLGALFVGTVPIAWADDEDDDESEGRSGRGPGDRGPSDRGNASERGGDDDDDDEGDDDDEDEHDDDEGRDGERGEPRKPGRFRETNSSFQGRFVSFQFSSMNCEVTDYRLFNTSLFQSIRIHQRAACESEADHGAKVEIEAREAELKIHDNPNGLIRFETEDDNSTIRFTLASGATLTNQTNRSVNISAGNLTARLFLSDHGILSVEGRDIAVTDTKGNFIVHPPSGDSPQRKAVREAIHTGRVGGEIDVLVENGSIVQEVLAFDDVVIKVSKKNDSNYRFLVDANLTEGRVFTVNFAPGAFKAENVGVRYYDVDEVGLPSEVAIERADNLSDVLQLDSGEGPEFWIVKDDEGRHVLVAVPHFSVHIFEVMALSVDVVPVVVYGAVVGVIFVAAATTGMLMGRKR